MKISIITATFNSAATIRDTLESVKNQTYTNIEHIIVDGLSEDNTLSIVDEYPHIARVISEKDKGIYDAMNKGITTATGEIIGILNSDDFYINNNVIEKVVNTFKSKEVDSVYANLNFIEPRSPYKITRYWNAGVFSRKNMISYGWQPPHPTFFVKKSSYDKLGLFNLNFKIAADYELLLRFLYKNEVSTAYIPEITVNMRIGGESTKSLKNRWILITEYYESFKVNGLKPKLWTIPFRILSKIPQFILKP